MTITSPAVMSVMSTHPGTSPAFLLQSLEHRGGEARSSHVASFRRWVRQRPAGSSRARASESRLQHEVTGEQREGDGDRQDHEDQRNEHRDLLATRELDDRALRLVASIARLRRASTAASGAPRSSAPSTWSIARDSAGWSSPSRRSTSAEPSGTPVPTEATTRANSVGSSPDPVVATRRIASNMPSPAVRLSVRNSSTVGSSAETRARRRRARRCRSWSRIVRRAPPRSPAARARRRWAGSRTSERRARGQHRRRMPAAAHASCSPRNRSTLADEPDWRRRLATTSLPPSHAETSAADAMRERRDEDAEHRARIRGPTCQHGPRLGGEVGHVGRHALDEAWAPDPWNGGDDEPQAESERRTEHDADRRDRVQRSHRRSSGSLPSATIAR